MIKNIQDTHTALALDRSRRDLSSSPSAFGEEGGFAQVLAARTGSLANPPETGTEKISQGQDQNQGGVTSNSFTGFFKELQEKRLEELRKEILEEMGLTEQMLENMDPAARGRIEGMIAKEIQKRMMAQAAMDGNGEISLLSL